MGTGGKFEAKSLVGLTLDQFEVKSEIARGGMGVVYKGYQPSLDRWVAIKTLPIDLAGDRELVSRFQREAKAMAALNHNNIVQCIHSGESSGQYYIAMEYVEGPSVKDLLKSPTIETDKIFDILAQTCDGLEYAHKKGLVHRDIKPANLLYEEKTGCVKIADFGIAHFSKKDEDMLTLTADNVGMGTMNYMAPEQKINAKGVDHRADIYALGVIVYEAFTGKLPLGKFKLPSEVNPKLPRALDEVVTKCLSTEPADRYASCSEVKNVLLEAKAATNDKSIRRSMRDAIDRTLTAVLPNKTARYAFVGCAFLAFALVVCGLVGFMVFRATKGKTRDALVVQVAEARDAAEKAAGAGPAGEATKIKLSDGEAALKKADEASQRNDLDGQIAELRKALDAYGAAVEAVGRDKAEKAAQEKARAEEQAKELARKIDSRKAEVDALPDDGFKTAGLGAVEDARKAAAAGDGDAVARALTAAAQQVSNSKTTDDNLASLKKSAESLKEKKAEGDKVVEDVLALRKKGDIEAINAAVEAARTKLKELGGQEAEIKKPPVEKTPEKTPDKNPDTTPTPAVEDPKLVAAANDAEEYARDARKQAKEVVDYASKLSLDAGQAERTRAEETFDGAPGKPVAQRAAAYDEARKKFEGARDAALKGIRDALVAARTDASSAKELAPEAWHDADKAANDAETALEPARKAALLGEAVLKFRVAGNQANQVAKEKAQKAKVAADAARADAVKRVGDKHPSLAPGDALVAKGVAAKPADAVAIFAEAAVAFAGADLGPPKRLGFEVTPTNKRMTFIKDCADAVAGCPAGFVIAKGRTLTLYGNDLQVRSTSSADSIVRALATGDGDEIFVAQGVSNPTIARFIAGNTLAAGKPLPGALGQHLDDPIWALAYHRPSHRLFVAAGSKRILVFSTVDGSRQSELPTALVGLAPPISLAVLRGGSVAVSGVANAPAVDSEKVPENDWRFEVRRFRFDEGTGTWSAAGRPIANQSAAIVAAGDTLLGTTHEPEGSIQRFPGAASLADAGAPSVLPIESGLAPAVVKPKLGLKLAIYGRYLYLLDQAPGADEQTFTVRPAAVSRKRVKIYELKED